jgi:hypothetical protein
MNRIKSYLARKRSTRSFVAAVIVALVAMPVAEALAYFSSTGTGSTTATAAQASTVSIAASAGNPNPTYGGPSTTAVAPGGTVTQALMATCLTTCPAYVSTISLAGWSSNKTGCDSTSLPGSFTMPPLAFNGNVISGGTPVGSVVITFVNLPNTDQTACAGATLTFNFTTP